MRSWKQTTKRAQISNCISQALADQDNNLEHDDAAHALIHFSKKESMLILSSVVYNGATDKIMVYQCVE